MDNTSVPTATIPDDSGTFAVSEKLYDSFNKINKIIEPTLCTLGILGNCAGLVIFIRDSGKRKMIIYYYLIALFIFDSIFMFMSLFILLLELIDYFQLVANNNIISMCMLYLPYLDIALNHVRSALLIVMALERMVAVMFPFKLSRFILTRFPKATIFSLIIFSFGYNFPFLITFTINFTTTPKNRTIYVLSVIPEYQSLFLTTAVLETLILHYVAPIILFVVNAMIIISYSRRMKQKDQILRSSSGNDSQIKFTAIIVTVSVLYLLLSLPNTFIQTLMLIEKDYQINERNRFTFSFFMGTGNLLFNINAASDFPIYVLVSSQYRNSISSWVCRCLRGTNSNAGLIVLSKTKRDTKIGDSNNLVAVVADIRNVNKININN